MPRTTFTATHFTWQVLLFQHVQQNFWWICCWNWLWPACDKLITYPFLLSPRARLEYGFALGSAKETADICGGEYGGDYGKNEFLDYLNNDASLSTFQNWTQLIENLRTLASNYQGELTDEILQYEFFWKALDYKGRGYNTGAEELLRFLETYTHTTSTVAMRMSLITMLDKCFVLVF